VRVRSNRLRLRSPYCPIFKMNCPNVTRDSSAFEQTSECYCAFTLSVFMSNLHTGGKSAYVADRTHNGAVGVENLNFDYIGG